MQNAECRMQNGRQGGFHSAFCILHSTQRLTEKSPRSTETVLSRSALATDGLALKDRLLDAVGRTLVDVGAIAVTEQASGVHGAAAQHALIEAGRQIPKLLAAEPADRRLK